MFYWWKEEKGLLMGTDILCKWQSFLLACDFVSHGTVKYKKAKKANLRLMWY